MKSYDVIVIGAGSVGLPAAFNLRRAGMSVLVLDELASPGQGQNKAAIGGIRATHSQFAKITTCRRSLEIFKSWQATYGDDIGWQEGGYCFVAYTRELETELQAQVALQQKLGLEIDWLSAEAIRSLIPDINPEGLRGGTFSPRDASASPLKTMAAYYRHARSLGVEFGFNQPVLELMRVKDRIAGVRTPQGIYHAAYVVNAAGAGAAVVAALAGVRLPVYPEAHEAGITEPCRQFLQPMIVDMKLEDRSRNFYFYQNAEGQIVFCLTPRDTVSGTARYETSAFLPLAAQRMIAALPRLAPLRVRRTWCGLYPMTPDGFPLIGRDLREQGLVHVAGMCGQGFMLGPGIGELVARLLSAQLTPEDAAVLEGYALERDFSGSEAFK